MKKILFAASIAAMTLASCGGESTSKPTATVDNTPAILKGEMSLNLDIASSKLNWKGEMLGLYSHNGTIGISAGKVNLKEGKIVSGDVLIDMKTITPMDNAYEATGDHSKEGLIGHLGSADFFDISNNPTAAFAITSVSGTTGKGNLSIRGNTFEETIENLTITPVGENVKISGKITFDRTKYGVKFSMPVKEKVLSNDIQMEFELVAKK